jgi:hypothetical protein
MRENPFNERRQKNSWAFGNERARGRGRGNIRIRSVLFPRTFEVEQKKNTQKSSTHLNDSNSPQIDLNTYQPTHQ